MNTQFVLKNIWNNFDFFSTNVTIFRKVGLPNTTVVLCLLHWMQFNVIVTQRTLKQMESKLLVLANQKKTCFKCKCIAYPKKRFSIFPLRRKKYIWNRNRFPKSISMCKKRPKKWPNTYDIDFHFLQMNWKKNLHPLPPIRKNLCGAR